ncbi:MAG: FlgD immunoglobulin-like domain containing protein [Bacteroidota bacterium]
MKKIFSSLLLLGLFVLGSTAVSAQSVVPAKWLVTANQAWFNGASHLVRGMAYNPVTNHVLVASREPGVAAIVILNSETGDSIGALNMTGVSGGVYPFNRVGISADGRIYTTNLQTSVTKAAPLKIYTWTDESSAPVVAFSDSVIGPRQGDAIAVVGSGQETYVYVSGSASPGAVNVFKRSGDTLVYYKGIVPTGWAFAVTGVGPVTNGFGSFWINGSGKNAQSYDTLGNVVDTIPGTIIASGGSSSHYFEFAGRKYVGIYSGNASTSNPSVARFADVTNGDEVPFAAGITEVLGTTANANATGEVIFSPADTSVYVLSTNNGVGKYDIKLAAPVAAYNSRFPFVPASGENDTVYMSLTSMKPITGAKLVAYGSPNASSDQAVMDSAEATMSFYNGRLYSAIVPASLNRDGRRIDYRVEATDTLGVTGYSASMKGYFAGLTKMMLKDGPRDIDTSGNMLYTGYGIRSKLVAIAEDSVYQTTNNEIVLQDNFGGVTVFKSGTTLDIQRYNEYVVTGTTSQYNGKLQFVEPGLNFMDMGPAQPVMPRIVTIKELLEKAEELENTLVEIRGVSKTLSSLAWPAAGADANMMFIDASGDSATMRIDRDTEISGTPEPNYPVTIVGVAGQFDSSVPRTSGYQWLPRDIYDVIEYLSVRLPDTTVALINQEVILPAMVSPISGVGITAYQFSVMFDTTALQYLGANNVGTISEGFSFNANLVKNGHVAVAASGTTPLKDSGAVANFRFKVISAGTTPVVLSGQFNEGNPLAMFMGGVVVGNMPVYTREIVPIQNSKMTVGVTNVGHIGALNGYQDQVGFMFNSINALYEGSLVMGNAKNRVPNAARGPVAPSWNPGFRQRSQITFENQGSAKIAKATFDDSTYSNPLGITVDQYSILDTAAGKTGYFIMGFDVANHSGTAINNFRLGSFFDFDLTAAGDADRGGILKDSTNTIPGVNGGAPFKIHLAYQYNGTTYAGVVPVSQTVFAGGRITSGAAEVYSGKMVDSNKYEYISTFRTTNTYTDLGTADDYSIFSSVGPYTIAAGDTNGGAFAIVVGNSMAELLANARLAQKVAVEEFDVNLQILTGVGEQPEQLPVAFALDQNYPNPFNPATTIRFALPNNAPVRMSVYDILGREVRTLLNGDLNAGFHQVVWDGKNNAGTSVSSGVYIYRIEAGSFISTKKMMLMK